MNLESCPFLIRKAYHTRLATPRLHLGYRIQAAVAEPIKKLDWRYWLGISRPGQGWQIDDVMSRYQMRVGNTLYGFSLHLDKVSRT